MNIEWNKVTWYSKLAALALFVALPFVGFYYGAQYGRMTAPIAGRAAVGTQKTGDSGTLSASLLPLEIVTNRDASASLYKLAIEYPQFPSAPDALNSAIRRFVDARLTEFKRTIAENWAARQATRPTGTPEDPPTQMYYFSVSWESAQLNPHYVSIILRKAAFEGGANESQEIATFNYDLLKSAPVFLADFFPGKVDYLASISAAVREQLFASLRAAAGGDYDPGAMLAEGTTASEENFKNFTFTDDVITFYFPKYQVAPGAFGEQHAGLSRRSLAQ